MPPLLRLEIWSDYQAAGGSRVAVVADALSCTETRKIPIAHTLALAIPMSSKAASVATSQKVVRALYADNSFDEWRITSPVKGRDDKGLVLTLNGVDPSEALGRSIVRRVEADGSSSYDFAASALSPAMHLSSFILPSLAADGVTWISAGTIDSSVPIDQTYAGMTALAALQAIATTAQLELNIRRNGTAGYYVDLVTQIGSSAAVRHVRLTRDLITASITETPDNQATAVVPLGTASDSIRPTMGGAKWAVVTVVGAVVTLADPDGGDPPIAFDDQFNTMGLVLPSGSVILIDDTDVATQSVTLHAAPAGLVTSDLVSFHTDVVSQIPVTQLTAPAALATYGRITKVLDRQDLPDTDNIVPNPAFAAWTGSMPDGWDVIGSPTVAKETSAALWQNGGASAHVTCAVDGEGLVLTDPVTIDPTAANPYASFFAAVQVVAGSVRIELVANDGTTDTVLPDGSNGKAYTSQQGQFVSVGEEGIDLHALATTNVLIRVVQDGATAAEFYLDSAQISQTPTNVAFLAGSGRRRLWQAANQYLVLNSAPGITLAVTAIDLARLFAKVFSGEEITLGGDIRATDSDLNADIETRVMQIQRDLFVPGTVEVTLSILPQDIIDELAPAPRAPRLSNTVVTGVTAAARTYVEQTGISDTEITFTVRGVVPGGTPSVRLVTTSAAIDSGASVGTLVASGSSWTFARPTSDQNPAIAKFEAVFGAALRDPATAVIPSQSASASGGSISMAIATTTIQIAVSPSVSGWPGGTTFDLDWEIDGGASGSVAGISTSSDTDIATSVPYNATGTVTITAKSSGTPIGSATNSFSGPPNPI